MKVDIGELLHARDPFGSLLISFLCALHDEEGIDQVIVFSIFEMNPALPWREEE